MSLKNLIKVSASIAMLSFLAGCAVTGEPRDENVAFNDDGYTIANEQFRNAITVDEVTNFPGTSSFSFSGRVAPNFSDESFKEVLELSLKNADFYGEGYLLNANLIDSGDWSDWGVSLGNKSRRIEIEYTLTQNGETVFNETFVSDISQTNYNPLAPFYLTQRKTAEINYAENIKMLIEKLNMM
ncbi:hypothetical protein [Halomonas sp. QHL1]|uniref:hypothetical protein n=1 Tax=Halomonas sp. QHL1 TaxID=1123773 RepID=UPI0008FCF6B0|nr:hypothetical protein [Halomonas sp. QHL1]OJA05991.1 hypothetical protein QHL1GM_11670 [Halomonas sp. QHL1]